MIERDERTALRRLGPTLASGHSALIDAAQPPESPRGAFPRLMHVHRFRWAGEDPLSPHNLYRCRCGQVRHGL